MEYNQQNIAKEAQTFLDQHYYQLELSIAKQKIDLLKVQTTHSFKVASYCGVLGIIGYCCGVANGAEQLGLGLALTSGGAIMTILGRQMNKILTNYPVIKNMNDNDVDPEQI